MEFIRSIIASLLLEDVLVSVDIKAAYMHVPIFHFALGTQQFQFIALHFGLSTSLQTFTKVQGASPYTCSALLSEHSHGMGYLNEHLLKEELAQTLSVAVQHTV